MMYHISYESATAMRFLLPLRWTGRFPISREILPRMGAGRAQDCTLSLTGTRNARRLMATARAFEKPDVPPFSDDAHEGTIAILN